MTAKYESEIDEILRNKVEKYQAALSALNLTIEYHKGEWCRHYPTFCQEGYCADCELALRRVIQ